MFPAKHLLKAEACSQLTNPKMVDCNVRDVFNKESREPDLGHWKSLINLFAQTLKLFMNLVQAQLQFLITNQGYSTGFLMMKYKRDKLA